MKKELQSKERAYLRKLASSYPAILQLGKDGISPAITKACAEALLARELIKVACLPNCEALPKEAAAIIAERTGAEVVTVIGRKFVLFKSNPKLKDKAIKL